MKYLSIALTALCMTAALPQSAQAEDMISAAIGSFDVGDDDSAVDFRMEYRFGTPMVWQIKPWLGIEATSDGAVYAGGGALADLDINEDWVITPGAGIGLFGDGDGKDMDGLIQLRTQIELGYKFDDRSRVSAGYSYISNTSMDEDGANVLGIYYHVPSNWIFH